MTAVYFVDSNVLLYAVSTTPDEADKRTVARRILNRSDIGFSVQVLQEFYVQAMRRTPEALPHEVAVNYIRTWLRFPVQEQTTRILTSALEARVRYQISYWDAAIIEAAKALSTPFGPRILTMVKTTAGCASLTPSSTPSCKLQQLCSASGQTPREFASIEFARRGSVRFIGKRCVVFG